MLGESQFLAVCPFLNAGIDHQIGEREDLSGERVS